MILKMKIFLNSTLTNGYERGIFLNECVSYFLTRLSSYFNLLFLIIYIRVIVLACFKLIKEEDINIEPR